jgi:hypothetical protein
MTNINFQNYNPSGLKYFFIGGTVIFGAFSIGLHFLVEFLFTPIKWLILFLDLATVPTFFALALYYIEHDLWKRKRFHFLVDQPDLNGRYEGKLLSSFMENNIRKEMPCAIEILQTASSLNISAYFQDENDYEKKSSSTSSLEKIIKKGNGFYEIYYNFSNTNGALEELLKAHFGTGRFDYYPDQKILRGEYFNVKGNTGKIEVKFVSSERLGRFN